MMASAKTFLACLIIGVAVAQDAPKVKLEFYGESM